MESIQHITSIPYITSIPHYEINQAIKVFEFFLSYMPQITFNDHLLGKK